MTACNLLGESLISAVPHGRLTLPGVLAALARDEIESFPALRAHQGMLWHMFLVQLAALALHRARETEIPADEEIWCKLLRGLTPEFPDDEPWRLVVEDRSKPAFMQPPVPAETKLSKTIATPDALDLLITSKNHDLKQSVGRLAEAEEWLFALVSAQTGATYDVQNCASVRTGNRFAPRICLELALAPEDHSLKSQVPRAGLRFTRCVQILLKEREQYFQVGDTGFAEFEGLGLTWLAEWRSGDQPLSQDKLDPWFIETCRRIRFMLKSGAMLAEYKSEKLAPIKLNAKLNSDPWTPVHKTENKLYAVRASGFHYKEISKLLFGETNKSGSASHDWNLPILLKASSEDEHKTLLFIAQGICGESTKSGSIGFHARILPLSGKIASTLWSPDLLKALHEVAQEQIKEIAVFEKALSYALKLAAVNGNEDTLKEKQKTQSNRQKLTGYVEAARASLDRFADMIFFEHLWQRFEAADDDRREAVKRAFLALLWGRTQDIFEEALPAMPCASLFRPRAEARARAALRGQVMKNFESYLNRDTQGEEVTNDAA